MVDERQAEGPLRLRASIGMAYGTVGTDTASAVLARADEAMDEVKHARREAPSP